MKLKHTICSLLSAVSLTACSAKYDVYTEPTADFPMIGKTIQLKSGVLIKDLNGLTDYMYTVHIDSKAPNIIALENISIGYAFDHGNSLENRYESFLDTLRLEKPDVIAKTKRVLVYKPNGMRCHIKKVYLMKSTLTEDYLSKSGGDKSLAVGYCDDIQADVILFDTNRDYLMDTTK